MADLDFPVPAGLRPYVVESKSPGRGPAPFDLAADLAQVGPVRLAGLAVPGKRVVIAFTDATRACPDRLLVSWLVGELAAQGVAEDDITLLCATGLHRPMTGAERLEKLGPDLDQRIRIVNHQPQEPEALVDLGQIDGLPVVVNWLCLEADLLLATGVVEPHQYAGYSGGAKTVVIGCGGEATIKASHSAEILDLPGVRLGAIAGNPFQAFVRQAGRRIGLQFVVNVLLDDEGQIVAAAAGAPEAVHDHLVERARAMVEVTVPHPAHLALAGVSGPKAVNLYQASRAVTYLALSSRSPLLPGAPILLPAAIPEGAGLGAGEQRFYDIFARFDSPQALMEELRRTGFPAGGQRAYMLAQALARHPVIVVGAEQPDVVETCHMRAAAGMAEGLALAEDLARRRFNRPAPEPLDFLVVPHALLTLPALAE